MLVLYARLCRFGLCLAFSYCLIKHDYVTCLLIIVYAYSLCLLLDRCIAKCYM
jgi:hypothetical protein